MNVLLYVGLAAAIIFAILMLMKGPNREAKGRDALRSPTGRNNVNTKKPDRDKNDRASDKKNPDDKTAEKDKKSQRETVGCLVSIIALIAVIGILWLIVPPLWQWSKVKKIQFEHEANRLGTPSVTEAKALETKKHETVIVAPPYNEKDMWSEYFTPGDTKGTFHINETVRGQIVTIVGGKEVTENFAFYSKEEMEKHPDEEVNLQKKFGKIYKVRFMSCSPTRPTEVRITYEK